MYVNLKLKTIDIILRLHYYIKEWLDRLQAVTVVNGIYSITHRNDYMDWVTQCIQRDDDIDWKFVSN